MQSSKREMAAHILTDLRFNKGLGRKWLANKLGCAPIYLSFAASNTMKKSGRPYCPECVIDRVIEVYGSHE